MKHLSLEKCIFFQCAMMCLIQQSPRPKRLVFAKSLGTQGIDNHSFRKMTLAAVSHVYFECLHHRVSKFSSTICHLYFQFQLWIFLVEENTLIDIKNAHQLTILTIIKKANSLMLLTHIHLMLFFNGCNFFNVSLLCFLHLILKE